MAARTCNCGLGTLQGPALQERIRCLSKELRADLARLAQDISAQWDLGLAAGSASSTQQWQSGDLEKPFGLLHDGVDGISQATFSRV
mmetsp:Transcript_54997/g.159704  ORF Transcript_54997/g.159704 Transcript_54997/m.159704 type:complete len:87 (+) Transcript_54997:803-1063(+)